MYHLSLETFKLYDELVSPLFWQGTQKTVSKILRTCPRSHGDSEGSPRLNQCSDLPKICVPLSALGVFLLVPP